MPECELAASLIGWARTPHGFFVDPRQADYTLSLLRAKCWGLRLRCARCGHVGVLTVSDLESRFAPQVSVGALAQRLVCTTADCRSHEGLVEFTQDHAAAGRRDMAAFEAKNGG